MALGKATVIAENMQQLPPAGVEKYFLFVGVGTAHVGELVYVNTDSDLTAEIGGSTDWGLKAQLIAAKANAGPNWNAIAAPVATADWAHIEPAIDYAMNHGANVEGIILCLQISGVGAGAALADLQAKADEILATYERRVFILATTPPIANDQTWGAYIAQLEAYTAGVLADKTGVVASIFPEMLGIYAGRLANYATSIADSPMRVATGGIVGRTQSEFPDDSAGVVYSNAHALALNNAGFTVPQIYTEYPGIYCSDGTLLDAPTGDFRVIENRRVIDKAARAVRLVLVSMVGDRRFNNSTTGNAYGSRKLMRPLQLMSRSITFGGIEFPADIRRPVSSDIGIVWNSLTSVSIYMKARPYNSPKELTAHIMLDLEG